MVCDRYQRLRLRFRPPRLKQVRRLSRDVTTVSRHRPPIPQLGVPASVAVTMLNDPGGRPPEAPRSWGACPAPQTPLGTPLETPLGTSFAMSATLAANEIMDTRRRRGEPVLPMAFGEAGLPAHPLLRE